MDNDQVVNANTVADGGNQFADLTVLMNTTEKPEKFKGLNFKRWQQKMLFYFTTLNLERFLIEDSPIVGESEPDVPLLNKVADWMHLDFMCRNCLLDCLDDCLYIFYQKMKTAKELWDTLDRKYKVEDARAMKFVVGKFLDFNMVDNKTIISQVQELQEIIKEIHDEGMIISETFQVAATIEKLPPSWKNFKNYLRYKRKEMSMEQLIVRLKIEEDNQIHAVKANVMEHDQSSKAGQKQVLQLRPKGGVEKPKFKRKCFNCDEEGHRSNECRLSLKKNKNAQANLGDYIAEDVSDINMSAMVSLLGSNTNEWWIDTGATCHICSTGDLFSTFEPIIEEKVYMRNFVAPIVHGVGKVVLKMTSGKLLTLNNVLYVPKLSKNLISGLLLTKHGFDLVFKSEKFVLSKSGMFVGNGHVNEGMFKLNVITESNN